MIATLLNSCEFPIENIFIENMFALFLSLIIKIRETENNNTKITDEVDFIFIHLKT